MKGKQIWSQQEDQYMKILVSDEKIAGNWTIIAQKINDEFSNKMRSPKQCRERFINHTSLTENHQSIKEWTAQQNEALFNLFEKWGSRWTKISQQIKGKSENCVKNRFYGSLRKALRKMNRAAKTLVKKFKKQVKYESITRIIDASEGLFRLQSPLKQRSEQLSKKILRLAMKNQQEMLSSQAQQLIVEINKFNMSTRSYKSKKKIKNQGSNIKDLQYQNEMEKKETSFNLPEKQSFENSQEAQIIENSSSTAQENQNFVRKIQNKAHELQIFDEGAEVGLNRIYDDQIFYNGSDNKNTFDLDELLCELVQPLEFEAWI